MSINNYIEEILKVTLPKETSFDSLGLINSRESNTLSYIESSIYIEEVLKNTNITGLFISNEVAKEFEELDSKIYTFICDDPKYSFFTLYNEVMKKNYKKFETCIGKGSKIDSSASIAEYNVKIGNNVIIEPNVTLLPDVEIGDNVIIRAGSVIGSEGFEYKRTTKGIISVFHSNRVILKNNVEVGANCCVDKGIYGRDTVIGENSKIDNLVHIAHSVEIGENCLIVASAMIGGSTVIGNNVWIGPSACISDNINIGSESFITLGAVVVKDVKEKQKVTGNFAIPHDIFIKNLKQSVINQNL